MADDAGGDRGVHEESQGSDRVELSERAELLDEAGRKGQAAPDLVAFQQGEDQLGLGARRRGDTVGGLGPPRRAQAVGELVELAADQGEDDAGVRGAQPLPVDREVDEGGEQLLDDRLGADREEACAEFVGQVRGVGGVVFGCLRPGVAVVAATAFLNEAVGQVTPPHLPHRPDHGPPPGDRRILQRRQHVGVERRLADHRMERRHPQPIVGIAQHRPQHRIRTGDARHRQREPPLERTAIAQSAQQRAELRRPHQRPRRPRHHTHPRRPIQRVDRVEERVGVLRGRGHGSGW